MYLYAIYQNSRDEVVYVGITTKTVTWRFAKHLESARGKKPRILIAKAIKKYGPEDFEPVILGTFDSLEELKAAERWAIDKFNTYVKDGGYNLTRGGDGIWGYKFDPDFVKDLSERRRGWHHTPEAKAKIGKASARPKSDETKRKIGAGNRGKVRTPEHIAQRTATRRANGNYVFSDEHRRKMSEAQKGRHHSDDAKARIRAAALGNTRPCKPIFVQGTEFPSRGAALASLGISATKLYRMIRDGEAHYLDR